MTELEVFYFYLSTLLAFFRCWGRKLMLLHCTEASVVVHSMWWTSRYEQKFAFLKVHSHCTIATAIPLSSSWAVEDSMKMFTLCNPYAAHCKQKQIKVANRTVWTGLYTKRKKCGIFSNIALVDVLHQTDATATLSNLFLSLNSLEVPKLHLERLIPTGWWE